MVSRFGVVVNGFPLIAVTLLGIVIDVKLKQIENAPPPM
jgi:hypothetical protein